MTTISLSLSDLAISLIPIGLLTALIFFQRLDLTHSILVATVRLVLQLSLVGLVLKFVFAESNPWLIALISLVMLSVASYEIMARQKYRLKGWGALRIGSITLLISSFAVTLFGLTLVIRPAPWYLPQYAIPLFGMILSNTMTGISVGMDRLTTSIFQNRQIVEQRLMLGETIWESIGEYIRDSLRSGMIPVINAMATAGIVSLPGMMTGQILAGAQPTEAVKYQIMIWVFIAAGTGFGMVAAIYMTAASLFDDRARPHFERFRKRS
ncbi:MAG: iron export ABC transporter permease subunit FetB [Verrucomicrobia bacterium]|nr:iron export ABC transporter permease subunit FetB [Verrucomicrobiota bacterium]